MNREVHGSGRACRGGSFELLNGEERRREVPPYPDYTYR